MQDFCGGPLWDDDLTWATEDPDFTPCFHKTIMVWVPCGFLILFAPLEFYFIATSQNGRIPWSFFNVGKTITNFLLFTLATADLAVGADLWISEVPGVYPVHIVTPVILMVTFILSMTLMLLHKRKGIRSSGLMFLFWLAIVFLAIFRFRSQLMNFDPDGETTEEQIDFHTYQYASVITHFSLCVIMLLLNCFSDKPPEDRIKVGKPSPEISSSFLRKLFFQWFDPMTWKGYRKPLEISDMWDLNTEDQSRSLIPGFDKHWYTSVQKNQMKSDASANTKKSTQNGYSNGTAFQSNSQFKPHGRTNGSVLPAMVKAFGGPFWFAGILKLIIDLLSFASPQLLGLLIAFTSNLEEPLWRGLFYAFLMFAVALLTLFLNGQYFHMTFLVGFRIRSALISAIYRKALRVSSSAKKDTTVGEIVNLMAVDAHRFFELVSYLHLLWSGPLVMALALYFLYDLLGAAIFAGLAVMILMIPLNAWIAVKLRSLQMEQMKKKDHRVKIMNEILGGMKVLKLYAWEPSFEQNVKDIREEEISVLFKMAYYSAGTFFAWTLAPFLVSLACFTTYVFMDEGNDLDATTAFMSLALLNILRMPMTMFPMVITMSMQAWVAVTRINKFMNSEELDPDNVTHHPHKSALVIENGLFTWGEEEVTLKNINMNVPKGALTAVVGPVGCGKSSLISALLGEMEKKQGNVNTDGTIAYVPQQAWIQNATLQDNILFGMKMNRQHYDKVIEACALKADIDMLPGGDQTEIGEKGINLSGGQKQRVSLARAVYSGVDIYLLDDPLSAVDAHVGKHIFDNVIGPKGLLAGKTRLLVTHGISYLPHMDEILVISNGEISESGHYKELLAQKGAFSEFLVEHLQEMEDDEVDEIKEVLAVKPEGRQLLERALSIRSTSSKGSKKGSVRGSMRGSMRKRPSNSSKLEKEGIIVPKVGTTLIEKEESATGKVSWAVYIKYFKGVGVWMTFWALLMNLLNQGFSAGANLWLTRWAEDDEAHLPANRDMYLGVYGALGGGQAITLFFSTIALAIGCLKAAKTLHHKLLSHTLRLPMSFFDTTPLGRIMNRFSKDVDIADNILPMSIRSWILMVFSVVFIFVVISITTPIFMSVIIPIGIFYYFIQTFYVATSRQLKRIESVTRSPIYSHFGESLTGQPTIRAYGKQDGFTKQNEDKVDFNQMCSYPSIIANRWLAIRLELVGSFVILFACLFAVLGREDIDASLVGLSVTYALQTTQVLNFMVRMTAEVETNIVAIERMEEYSHVEKEAEWEKGERDPLWPKEGRVDFENFQVRYREGLDLVLKGITFSVKSCEKIGIVGRTGAGKSSLTLALFRIIEAAGGKITIDDKNIGELGLHNLRSRLTIIPQDPVLFSGSLRMNIDPFNSYSDDEIWRVLELSHLKHFVKGLQAGLQHEISEGGENLSVGQRQLICLARALLRKTKVLVLDEATAAVDLETDDLIQKTIRAEFADCTILTIAHRLNTIMDSDKVIVLDKGEIAEFDTPTNLLQNPNSIFHSMAKNAGIVGNSQ
ncbi:multidrug resistance-associated protein 1-like [Phlebotomus argentipes]|uniref:multidrug resistance-associated protein 1-like n=1 Tax=Phlebotomus argentipes TaxID=94469 RepID=UPI002892FA7D|nr:multidrug resistance-associated protein 1-like [Phlebotomus argentipes]